MLTLFEERPSGNQSDAPFFGNTEKVIGSFDVIDLVRKDLDNRVDGKHLVRSRLFDNLIGDWDRHDDQWRWASYKTKKGLLFKPIPRDRDQAFFKFKGIIPSIANRKWAMRKLQDFDDDIRDIAGLNFNGRYVDRSYLTELSLEDWKEMADTVRFGITDEVIDAALRDLPDSIYEQSLYLIPLLKSRRYLLPEFAERYYRVLAKEVDVVGSDNSDYFKVQRLDNEHTLIEIFKHKKKKAKPVYSRNFKTSETKEVRLYGLGGDDLIEISGRVDESILLRVIGGRGKDKIIDSSYVLGGKKMTRIYPSPGKKKHTKDKLKVGNEVRDFTKRKSKQAVYDRKAFVYDLVSPLAYFGFNVDDGIYIGGGTLIKKYGFNKYPYKYSQKIQGNFAVATRAYNFVYEGDFIKVLGSWDLKTDIKVQAPNFISNFYGLGNETVRLDSGSDYYRLRINQITIQPALKKSYQDKHTISFGPIFENSKVEATAGRFVSDSTSNLLDPDNFTTKNFIGLHGNYYYDRRNDHHNPSRGSTFKFEGIAENSMQTGQSASYFWGKIATSFSGYFTVMKPLKITYAFRIGGAHNIGKFYFYQANVLGGTKQMRGLRRNRFSGRTAFYQNNDLRIKIADLRTYIFPGELGIVAFYDQGRVWTDNKTSNLMHYSYGGGIWINLFEQFVISTYVSLSDDDELFSLQFGFMF
ncbi:MAG: hypothetical protein IH949_07085 [Bacteroidetes bacterium]|nr:hypothetical protein [Bacteroidota bacterium]